MISEPFRYPLREGTGRTAALKTAGSIVAITLGLRYTVAFAPSSLALGPMAATGVALVLLTGFVSEVLVADDSEAQRRSLRATIRTGLVTLALTVGFLAIPMVVLVTTVTGFIGGESPPGSDEAPLLLLGSMSSIVAFVALAYALPAAITAVARTGRLRAALDFETMLPALRDPIYFLRWTVGFTLLVLAVGCAAVTIRSTDVVGLLAALVAAYLLIAGMRAIGLGYARSTSAE